MLNPTPERLLPAFDAHPASKAGWLDECGEERELADDRFHTKA